MLASQMEHMAGGRGFIAALDQSGGSTPKALQRYGIGPDAYHGDDEMFDLVHAMRERIVTSPSFTGSHILGAILFEKTLARTFAGMPAADYLWETKHVVPFLKVDKGLQDAAQGVRLMKPIDTLDALLERAVEGHVFGTKMRSVIMSADRDGIAAVMEQQFELARRIIAADLVPILEPEIDIKASDKGECERILMDEIGRHLLSDSLDGPIMLKLTIPDVDGFYTPLIEHPEIVRVLALSGGYSRAEANERLARNPGLIASFSRALTEGLRVDMTPEEFDAALDESIRSIYAASTT
ncbi:MAG TPA: fructose bisphosphate aldolase [Propionibacteriaceae bacterium]|nr:fructose bisphosphate aldolase [Propionibacteriaceae bacterium]